MASADDRVFREVVFRHYTDDVGKVGIQIVGAISPGPDGRVYLTPDLYRRASEAQAKLSLPRRPTGYFEVPAESISDHSALERVLPDYGQSGGGNQVWVAARIDAEGLRWVTLQR